MTSIIAPPLIMSMPLFPGPRADFMSGAHGRKVGGLNASLLEDVSEPVLPLVLSQGPPVIPVNNGQSFGLVPQIIPGFIRAIREVAERNELDAGFVIPVNVGAVFA